jgi:protein O-GlcNAc transferase
MKLLKQKESSILWLLESNAQAKTNILEFSEKEGVNPNRIKFAPKVSFQDHINRHSVVDLFLDTYPYNAHTSSSDAVWAGCPVLTLTGETFASRVAGSILKEVGCEMLITRNEDEYYQTALALSNDSAQLNNVREMVLRGKENSSLFKTPNFIKKLENVYLGLLQK